MKPYQNLNGHSGVVAFEIFKNSIAVRFTDARVYIYTVASAGRDKLETMKALALAGKGLSTFISQHVREGYAQRLP